MANTITFQEASAPIPIPDPSRTSARPQPIAATMGNAITFQYAPAPRSSNPSGTISQRRSRSPYPPPPKQKASARSPKVEPSSSSAEILSKAMEPKLKARFQRFLNNPMHYFKCDYCRHQRDVASAIEMEDLQTKDGLGENRMKPWEKDVADLVGKGWNEGPRSKYWELRMGIGSGIGGGSIRS